MGYFLYALIGKSETFKEEVLPYKNARVVQLGQGIAIIPITDELYEEIDSSDEIEKFEKLSSEIKEWAQRISSVAPVAYIEAEFFGGVGGQSAILWKTESCVLGPIHEQHAINRVLKLLGVERGNAYDEFDAIGLGKHRDTDDWR